MAGNPGSFFPDGFLCDLHQDLLPFPEHVVARLPFVVLGMPRSGVTLPPRPRATAPSRVKPGLAVSSVSGKRSHVSPIPEGSAVQRRLLGRFNRLIQYWGLGWALQDSWLHRRVATGYGGVSLDRFFAGRHLQSDRNELPGRWNLRGHSHRSTRIQKLFGRSLGLRG